MIVLEDFTKAAAGGEIPLEGKVRTCPRCGRPGIEQRSEDRGRVVVHAQISEILGDGMRVEPSDCCALSRR